MKENEEPLNIEGWVVRVRKPDGGGPHPVILLLHGWTGDENSMWIFTPRLPKDTFLIAPRGIYKSPTGGYGWHPHSEDELPHVDEFQPVIKELFALLTPSHFEEANLSNIRIVGFSQGAALT